MHHGVLLLVRQLPVQMYICFAWVGSLFCMVSRRLSTITCTVKRYSQKEGTGLVRQEMGKGREEESE